MSLATEIGAIDVRISRTDDGLWEGFVIVKPRRGSRMPSEIVQRVSVDEREIRDELARRIVPEGASVGFFKQLGRWIKRTARKISRWKVWKQIGKVVKDIVKSPIVAGIVGVASTIFPVIGVGYAAARAAVTVAEGISKGDASVMKKVGTIAKAAANNNPLAADALAAVRAAERSPMTQFLSTAAQAVT